MFSNLSKGNVLYGLDLSGDKMTYFNEKKSEYKITQNKEMKFEIEKQNFEFTTYKKLVENNYETI